MSTPSMDRQVWLEKAMVYLRQRFEDKGYSVPDAIRISIGWPKGARGKGNSAIGQCWSDKASSDAHSEIFISPVLDDSIRIMGVLAHEIAHAVVGTEAGHKAPFKRCAVAIGLVGKMTATIESTEFVDWAQSLITGTDAYRDGLGPYPAGNLNPSVATKKQTTRLLKCECESCGYTVRVTAKWLEIGEPICPAHNEPMICDGGNDDD